MSGKNDSNLKASGVSRNSEIKTPTWTFNAPTGDAKINIQKPYDSGKESVDKRPPTDSKKQNAFDANYLGPTDDNLNPVGLASKRSLQLSPLELPSNKRIAKNNEKEFGEKKYITQVSNFGDDDISMISPLKNSVSEFNDLEDMNNMIKSQKKVYETSIRNTSNAKQETSVSEDPIALSKDTFKKKEENLFSENVSPLPENPKGSGTPSKYASRTNKDGITNASNNSGLDSAAKKRFEAFSSKMTKTLQQKEMKKTKELEDKVNEQEEVIKDIQKNENALNYKTAPQNNGKPLQLGESMVGRNQDLLGQNEELIEQMHKLREQNEELNNEVQKLRDENDELKPLKEKFDDMKTNHDFLKSRNEVMKQEMENLEKKLEFKELENEQLLANNQELVDKLSQLSKNEPSDSKNLAFQEKIIEDLKKKLENYEGTLTENQDTIEDLHKKITTGDYNLSSKEGEINDLNDLMKKIQDKLNIDLSDKDDQIEKMTANINNLNKEVSALNSDIQELEDKTKKNDDGYKTEMQNLNDKILEARRDGLNKVKESHDKNNYYSQVTDAKAMQQEDTAKKLQTKASVLEEKNAKFRDELDAAKQEILEKNNVINRLNGEISDVEDQQKRMEFELNDMDTRMLIETGKKENEIAQVKMDIENLQREINKKDDEIAKLKEKLDDQHKKDQELKKEQNEQRSYKERDLSQKNDEIQNLNMIIQNYQTKSVMPPKEDYNTEVDRLKNKIEQLEDDLTLIDKKNSEISQLNVDILDLKNKLMKDTAEKDKEISTSNYKYVDETKALNQKIEDQKQEFNNQLVEKDKEITELNEKLKENEDQDISVLQKNDEILEKNDEIQLRDEEINEQKDKVESFKDFEDTIEQKNKEIDKLKSEIKTLKENTEKENTEKEKDILIKSLEDNINEIKENYEQKDKQQVEKISELENELQQKDKQKIELELQLENLIQQKEQPSEDSEKNKKALEDKTKLINALKEELIEYHKITKDIDNQKKIISLKDENIVILENQFKEMSDIISKNTQDNRENLNKIMKDKNNEINIQQKQNAQMQSQLDGLSQLKDNTELLDSLTSQVKVLNSNLNLKNKELESSKKVINFLNNKILQLEGNEKIIRNDLRQKGEEIEMLKRGSNTDYSVPERLPALAQEFGQKDENPEVTELKNQIDTLQVEIKSLKDLKSALATPQSDEVSNLKELIAMMNNKISNLDEQINTPDKTKKPDSYKNSSPKNEMVPAQKVHPGKTDLKEHDLSNFTEDAYSSNRKKDNNEVMQNKIDDLTDKLNAIMSVLPDMLPGKQGNNVSGHGTPKSQNKQREQLEYPTKDVDTMYQNTNPYYLNNKDFDTPTNDPFPVSRFLFTTDDVGSLKQWDIKTKNLEHDWGAIHKGGIHLICSTYNQKFLFTASWHGDQKQWSISNKSLVKDYKKVHKGFINNVKCSRCSSYLFTTERYGHMKMISIGEMIVQKEFEKVYDGWIWVMCVTNDSKYLLTSGDTGKIKQFDINTKTKISDWEQQDNQAEIYSMAVGNNDMTQFTGDENGWLKKWDLQTQMIIFDFGQIHKGYIWPILVTPCDNFMFTSGGDGQKAKFFEKWSLRKEILLEKSQNYLVSCVDCSKDSKWIFTLNGTTGIVTQMSTEDSNITESWGKLHQGSKLQCLNIC